MGFENAYFVVIGLMLFLAIFYLSPYEMSVDEDEDEE
jgi:hypothetical protein